MDAANLDKSSFELFKQAIEEGLSYKFDSIADSYTEDIVCSEKHKLAMRTIVYGKLENAPEKKQRRLKSKYIIAIIVAAALLLTSCGIIFRHKIREIIREYYVSLNYGEDASYGKMIEDVYTLTYIPEGYVLENEMISSLRVEYKYTNQNGNVFYFRQRPLNSVSNIDSEKGESQLLTVQEYDIYCRFVDGIHFYLYCDQKYVLNFKSNAPLSDDVIASIIEGIEIK